MATNSHSGPSKAKPIKAAHDPETIIMPAVVRVRPIRSDSTPPSRQPRAPAAIAAKVKKEASAGDGMPCSAKAWSTYTRSHAHMA
jgi:hypothetical protein